MFSHLVWKEWRQLGLVRWGGIALAAILPMAFVAGAEMSKRGWLPTAGLRTYQPHDLMSEVLPYAYALAVWPLIALMSAAQAFAGDRAAGTESFLLERPVPRTTTWAARAVASIASILVVLAVSVLIAAIVAWMAEGTQPMVWKRWMLLWAPGLPIVLLGWIGCAVASTVIPSPLGAVLAGAVVGGSPVLVGAWLGIGFPYAEVRGTPIGAGLPVLMLPGFVLASWSAASRGEPAGRGRVKRGLTIALAGLASGILLFVITAPIAVRAGVASGTHGVVPSPAGRFAFVGNNWEGRGGGWLVDVAAGDRRFFLPPPISDVTWGPDGTRLAVVTWSGPLGGAHDHSRIEIVNADRAAIERTISVRDDAWIADLEWAPGGIVVVTMLDKEFTAAIVDPDSGSWRPTGYRSKTPFGLVTSGPAGRVYARVPNYEKDDKGEKIVRSFSFLALDLAHAKVTSPVVDAAGRTIQFAGVFSGISPSGRYARISGRGEELDHPGLADLTGDGYLPHLSGVPWHWLEGDRMMWRETLGDRTRLFLETPGQAPTVVREWRNASVSIALSTDRKSVLVSAVTFVKPPAWAPDAAQHDPRLFEGEAPQGRVPEEGIYRLGDGAWTALPPFSERQYDGKSSDWAGPKTVAHIAAGVVAFEDIDAPGKPRFVLGP